MKDRPSPPQPARNPARPLATCALVLAAGGLLAALGVTAFGGQPPARTFRGKVDDLLPDSSAATAGWNVARRPVAETAEMKKALAELLNFDDAAYVVYSRGDLTVSVYLAYWTPGKMPARLIASHTPDVCWVGAGWKPLAATSQRSLPLAAGGRAPGAEEREMEFQGRTEWVLFWHQFGGEEAGRREGYRTGERAPFYAALRDLWESGLDQRREQFFFRISANAPVDTWWRLPLVQQIAGDVFAATAARPGPRPRRTARLRSLSLSPAARPSRRRRAPRLENARPRRAQRLSPLSTS